MKKLSYFTLLLLLISCSSKNEDYLTQIRTYQYEQNTHFANPKETPLTEEGLKLFKALDFFDIDENYHVVASFELTPDTPIFEMPTTTDRLPLYRKYGIARFKLNGKKLELSIYQNQKLIDDPEYADYLFLPYKDLTNGELSYGGGRYIDITKPTEGSNEVIIDFNKSYSPLCAYNHERYSCPIPPAENHLGIAIYAGVKKYDGPH